MVNLNNFKLESLKDMSFKELDELAKAIRTEIIDKVSQNGGHLASNLGVVELTIALHYVFNSPIDKIIFDVSHQTYVHKILTGRSLENLRTKNGVSGFAKHSESIHDVYEGGHSSTSIAAGLGFLYSKETSVNIGEVISVIGDASVTNGLAFSALNLLGAHPNQKMIVIINDNNMSISKNVGAMAKTLNKIRSGKSYSAVKRITPRFLLKFAKKVSGSLKSYVYQNKFFTSLGYSYIEGIDGHNIKELVKYFTYAKNKKNSVVLHVKTQKGKGYFPAEIDLIGKWHNTTPFNIETGKQTEPNMLSVGEYLSEFISNKKDEWKNSYIITPAMSLGSGLTLLEMTYGNRFIDCGIAEDLAVVMASSLSLSGNVPFVFMYSSFLQRAYDQVLHDIARNNLHSVFLIDRCGIVSGDGDTHQGIYDVAFLKTIPGVTIFEPISLEHTVKCLEYAYNNKGVYFIRYPKYLESSKEEVDVLNWNILKPLTDINIVATGKNVLKAKALIEDKNIGLISANILTQVDSNILNSLKENSKLIVFEENIQNNSLYNDIVLYCYKHNLKVNIISKSLPNTYLISATSDEIIEEYDFKIDELIKF